MPSPDGYEELSAQSGALALVTNLVNAWTTRALQATLNRWHAELGPDVSILVGHRPLVRGNLVQPMYPCSGR
jgi:hypothetical protein